MFSLVSSLVDWLAGLVLVGWVCGKCSRGPGLPSPGLAEIAFNLYHSSSNIGKSIYAAIASSSSLWQSLHKYIGVV